MKKILHNLRNRPDHVKSRLVIVFAVFATVLVIAIWVISLQLVKTPDDIVKTESPLKVFGQIFTKSIGDVKTNYKNQKDSLSATMSNNSTVIPADPVAATPDETAPATVAAPKNSTTTTP